MFEWNDARPCCSLVLKVLVPSFQEQAAARAVPDTIEGDIDAVHVCCVSLSRGVILVFLFAMLARQVAQIVSYSCNRTLFRQGPLDDMEEDDAMFERRRRIILDVASLPRKAVPAASVSGHKHLTRLRMDENSVTKVRHEVWGLGETEGSFILRHVHSTPSTAHPAKCNSRVPRNETPNPLGCKSSTR